MKITKQQILNMASQGQTIYKIAPLKLYKTDVEEIIAGKYKGLHKLKFGKELRHKNRGSFHCFYVQLNKKNYVLVKVPITPMTFVENNINIPIIQPLVTLKK